MLLASGAGAQTDGLAVEIAGVEGQLAQNVRARLGILAYAERLERAEPGDGGARDDAAAPGAFERRIRRLHNDARTEIERALRPFGYYEPAVRSSLEHTAEGWIARYEIEAGEPVRIDAIDVRVVGEGRDAAEIRSALAAMPFASGRTLRHAEYDRFKQRLFDAAYNAGYVDAEYVRAELRVRRDARAADVHLVLDTGPRHYFGPLHVEQDILNQEFIDRYIPIQPGEPFDADRLIELQLALGDSGYFSDVTIEVLRGEESEQRIPVRVATTPRPNQALTAGVGYGTDTGPRLRFGVELRRVNRNGHRFDFDTRLSAVERTARGEYRIPVRNYATDYISYRGSLGTEDIGDFQTEQLALGASWTDRWRGMLRRFYVEARDESFAPAGRAAVSARALFPGARLSRQRTDDALHPREARSWSADLRAGADAFGSTRFARLHLTGSYLRPLGQRGRVILRGEYGAIAARDFARLVPSQRFFAGGDDNVRGYAYQSLGPTDAEGATIGGRYLATASVELDYLFFGDYGGAVFADAGNASNAVLPEPQRSVGIGLRWRSPVGMLRVDFAHPLDDPDEDFRLHLSIGTSL